MPIELDNLQIPKTLGELLSSDNNAAGNKITNLGTPTNSNDAATKSYVDTHGGGGGGSQTLAQTLALGNDADGYLITDLADPVNPQDAATKSYVDGSIPPPQPTPSLSTVLSAGNSAGSLKIVSLANPTNPQDAATKNYVDSSIPSTPSLSTVLGVGNSAGNSKITNLGDPTVALDAVNKQYIDGYAQQIKDGYKNYTDIQVLDGYNDLKSYIDGYPFPGSSQNLTQVLTIGNSAGNLKITNLATPTDGYDAVNKNYIDGYFSSGSPLTLIQTYVFQNKAGNGSSPSTPTTNWDGYYNSYGKYALITATATAFNTTNSDSTLSMQIDGYTVSTSKVFLNSAARSTFPSITYITKLSVGSHYFKLIMTPVSGISIGSVNDFATISVIEFSGSIVDGYFPRLSDVLKTNNSADGYKITNLGTPTLTADAATKGYVDGYFSSFNPILTIVPLTGANNTLLPTYVNKYITLNHTSDGYILLLDGYFSAGQQMQFCQIGTGQFRFGAGPGVSILTPETLKFRKQYSSTVLTCITSTTFHLAGDLELI